MAPRSTDVEVWDSVRRTLLAVPNRHLAVGAEWRARCCNVGKREGAFAMKAIGRNCCRDMLQFLIMMYRIGIPDGSAERSWERDCPREVETLHGH